MRAEGHGVISKARRWRTGELTLKCFGPITRNMGVFRLEIDLDGNVLVAVMKRGC